MHFLSLIQLMSCKAAVVLKSGSIVVQNVICFADAFLNCIYFIVIQKLNYVRANKRRNQANKTEVISKFLPPKDTTKSLNKKRIGEKHNQ